MCCDGEMLPFFFFFFFFSDDVWKMNGITHAMNLLIRASSLSLTPFILKPGPAIRNNLFFFWIFTG